MNSTARKDSAHNSQVIESQAPSLDQLRIELALTVLATPLTVCKLAEEPTALPAGELCYFTRTSDEISLVCETADAPVEDQVIFISHGDCIEDVEYLESLIEDKWHPKKIFHNILDPVIGAHAGPGTLALFFLANGR